MRLLIAGHVDAARQPVADLWGSLPEAPLHVVCGAGTAAVRDELFELLDAAATGWFFADVDDHVVVLAAERDAGQGRLEGIAPRVPGLQLGVSHPVGYPDIADGHRQAVQAARAVGRSGAAVLRFGDIAGHGLLSLVPGSDAAAFAASLLDPLIAHDESGRGDLLRSLREWLRHHGQWDPAAARLGVHRHTLRNRMAKVEELAGIDLDDPGVRAELWLALQLQRTPHE